MSIFFNKNINITIEPLTEKDISENKSIELRALKIFQNIDSLGNYSNVNWFYNLNKDQLLKFGLNLICVAVHYSKRYDNSDGYLDNKAYNNLRSYAYYLRDNKIEELQDFFRQLINSQSQSHRGGSRYYKLVNINI